MNTSNKSLTSLVGRLMTLPSEVKSSIASITDNSDGLMRRARIKFINGFELSVIRGEFSYGSENGLFEIAIFDVDGDFARECYDECDQGDGVVGNCDVEKVLHYIEKTANLEVKHDEY